MTETIFWYALYVRSRHEFVAYDALRRKGIETFLPSITRMKRWSDREKAVEFPLFPGYLFVRTASTAERQLEVLRTRGAVALVSFDRPNPTPVADEEIDALRKMVESGQPIDLYPGLRSGMPVRVVRGPLRGAYGILGEKEDQYTFLVNIEILGRSVGVSISADDFDKS